MVAIAATPAGSGNPLSIIRTIENLGRTLIKINWQTGGESLLLPDDLDSW
jgi:hypothetical protein